MSAHPAGTGRARAPSSTDLGHDDRWTGALVALACKLGLVVFGSESYDILLVRIAAEVQKRGWSMPTLSEAHKRGKWQRG